MEEGRKSREKGKKNKNLKKHRLSTTNLLEEKNEMKGLNIWSNTPTGVVGGLQKMEKKREHNVKRRNEDRNLWGRIGPRSGTTPS